MPQKTLDQKRAEAALKYIRALEASASPQARSEYLAKIKQVPGLIAVNGLIPALVHLKASNIREHIEDWLKSEEAPVSWKSENQKETDVSKRLLSEQAAVYRQATEEALRFTAWLKRWAQAYFEEVKSVGQAVEKSPSA
ncbi:MAG: type III-B CRISPR module-associated protein Cmr5 [Bryobacteraceae bacterium]